MADDNKLNIQITAEDLTTAVIAGVQEGMKSIESAVGKTGTASRKSADDLRELSASAPQAGNAITDLIGRYGGLTAAATAASAALKQSIDAALGMEKINAMLKSATGSAEEAGLAYQFIRQEAYRLGLDIETSAKSFAKFAASARGTSLEGEGVRKVFISVAEAGTAMKLSTEELDGVLLALSQMMSKGTVQAEELRGQLGERLPGAYKLAAEAMGLTEQQLGKQLELGQVMATDMLPKLAEKLHQVYGPAAAEAAKGTTAEFARLKTEVFEQSAAFGKDLLPAVNVVLSAMSGGVQVIGAMIKIFKDLTSIVFAAGFAFEELAKLTYGGGLFSEKGRAEFEQGMKNIKETLLTQLNDMGAGQEKYYKTENQRKEEAARNEQRRLEESKKALEANKKAQSDYIKTIADQEARLTADYQAEYEKKRDIIKAYFDSQLKAVAKGSADEQRLNKERADALDQLERESSTSRARIGLEVRETSLKQSAAQMQAEIALVEKKLATQELSEREAWAKITELRKQQADAELKLAQDRVSVLAVAGLQGTEEYRRALGEQVKAQKEVNGLILAEIKQHENDIKKSYAERVDAARTSYQADLNDLKEAENNKSLTVEDAILRRLKLERDYAEQLSSIRAQELQQYDPVTQAELYQKALQQKLDADRQYLEKKKAVDDEEAKQFAVQTKKHADEIKARLEAERVAAEQSRAFADSWFGLWDAAYNDAIKSLNGLSEAAYNAFAQTQDLPLKSAESMETLRQKAEETAASYGKLYRQAQESGLYVGAAWADAYRSLNMIPAEAARITAEYYKQKLAAEELALALANPTNATAAFVRQSNEALKGMELLDNASLEKLRGGIDSINNAMLQFTEKTREALKSLQDEFDQLTLSKVQLEEKRYNEQKTAWLADYNTARQQGNDQAIEELQQQLTLIEEIHKIKLADLKADQSNTISPVKRALGGWIPGVGSTDTVPAMLTPGEYVVRKSAAGYWGAGILSAINNPWGHFGQQLQARLAGIAQSLPVAPTIPRLAYASGGDVAELPTQQGNTSIVLNITVPKLDETAVRRDVLPVIERYAKLRG